MRDLPDYTKLITVNYEGGFVGLEELAARLGSIAPFNLKGNIVLMEDFESEETEWMLETSGVDSVAARTSRHKFSGDWAIKLTAGGGATDYAQMRRQIYCPGLSKLAIFARIAWVKGSYHWELFATYDILGVSTYARVGYDLETGDLYIKTTGGNYQAIASSLFITPAEYAFYPILLTVDLVNGKYDKLYFGDTEYDLSTYELSTVDDLANTYLEVGVINYGGGSYIWTIYVDDIIIAKNVP